MTKLSSRQWAAIKRTAQNVQPFVIKLNKVNSKIKELEEEKANLLETINGLEYGIKSLTGGYSTTDLVYREVTRVGEITMTKYLPTELIHTSEDGSYEIMEVIPTSGSDFDLDKANAAPVDEVETTAAEAPFNPINI